MCRKVNWLVAGSCLTLLMCYPNLTCEAMLSEPLFPLRKSHFAAYNLDFRMPRRFLKYGATSHDSLLGRNLRHMYAHRHAILIYRSNAIYTLIPKNACSTLRLSIAVENGAIRGIEDAEWIHLNNGTFFPSLGELMRADYAFVFLRCPFARLASCFLDKFVGGSPETEKYAAARGKRVAMEELTFRTFCVSLAEENMLTANIHWAPQVNFLVFADYDDYFCFERFDDAIAPLRERAGLEIIDARPATRHGIDVLKRRPAIETFCDVPLNELKALRAEGETPDPVSLYDVPLIDFVRRTYAEDLALFNERFPGVSLFKVS